jgi:hypothetical protein
MANAIKTGHFESDGADVAIPLGFIPDWVRIVEISGGAAGTVIIEWFRMQEQDQASGTQEGFSIKEGTTDELADSQGIIAYDSSGEAPTVNTWTQSRSNAATARTATADGTFIRPSSSSTTDHDTYFECVTAGTGAATEPSWNTGIGEQTTDGSTVWECVREPRRRYGYKGFLFAGEEQTDADEYYYIAIKADENEDHGDVTGWSGGVQGA